MTTETTHMTLVSIEGRSGTATPTHKWRGKHGTVVVWEVEDGTHVATSSAYHYLDGSSAMNPEDDMNWMGRAFTGQLPHGDSLVSETVVFDSDAEGRFSSFGEVAKIFAAEHHHQAMRVAGYVPETIPDDLPETEVPRA